MATKTGTRTLRLRFADPLGAEKAVRELSKFAIIDKGPIMSTPVNGRPWLVIVLVPTYSLSTRYPAPEMMRQVLDIVVRYGGSTAEIGA